MNTQRAHSKWPAIILKHRQHKCTNTQSRYLREGSVSVALPFVVNTFTTTCSSSSRVWEGGSPNSCEFGETTSCLGLLVRQMGQVLLFSNHVSRHCTWNACPQHGCFVEELRSMGSMQMTHSSSLNCSSADFITAIWVVSFSAFFLLGTS